MPSFDLRENAFALLATHPRANRAQLEDAYQDAFLDAEDPASEARLNRAQQYLVSPKDRLDSELSFFIDTKPTTIKAVLAGLGTPDASSSSNQLAGLDRANFFAHLCGEGSVEDRRKAALALIDAYEAIEPGQVLEVVNGSRAISGFALTELGAVRSALNKVCSKHSAAVLDALLLTEHGSDHVAELAQDLADCAPHRRVILESILREYEARVGPELERGTDRIHQLLMDVTEGPDAPGLIGRISESLRDWDRKAQPLQVADRVRGIDEHHSRHLFEVVRETCLSLANDRQLFQQSLAISQVALEVFAELPDAALKLSEDVETLQDLMIEKEQNDRLAPLATAVEKAQDNHSATCRALEKSGFQSGAAAPAGEVHRAFVAIISGHAGTELNGMAARLVRNLGIDICNQSSDNEGALAIVEGLLHYGAALPNDVTQALENDRATLTRNIDFNAMLAAMKAGRWNEADRLAERQLVNADDENRQMLLGVRSNIAERKRSRLMKMIGWGVFAIFILFVVLSEESKKTGSTAPQYDAAYDADSAPTDEITVEAAPESSSSDAAVEEPAAPEATVSMEESPPAPYQSNNTVTVSELRYCKRQKARITAVESDVSSTTQIDRYNAAIDDYNSRCGSFRYRQTDMDQVDGEIANDATTLRSEGLEIIGGGE